MDSSDEVSRLREKLEQERFDGLRALIEEKFSHVDEKLEDLSEKLEEHMVSARGSVALLHSHIEAHGPVPTSNSTHNGAGKVIDYVVKRWLHMAAIGGFVTGAAGLSFHACGGEVHYHPASELAAPTPTPTPHP